MLPAIFFGHGNPMNALAENAYTAGWRSVGVETPRPRAILSISAHWFVPGTGVTVSTAPRTIHDFGGFPERVVSGAISGAGRSGPGPAGADTTPTVARSVGQLLGFGPRHMVGASPCLSAS